MKVAYQLALRAMLKPCVAGVAACALQASLDDRARDVVRCTERTWPIASASSPLDGSLCHPPLLYAETRAEKAHHPSLTFSMATPCDLIQPRGRLVSLLVFRRRKALMQLAVATLLVLMRDLDPVQSVIA